MAAVGAEAAGSWFLSSGVVSFFILLLLLSIFLTALCSNCGRRSFKLRDTGADKNPSALIRVVKLEETVVPRENPMIGEIQKDEEGFKPKEENPAPFTPWRSHLGAPQNNQDVWTNGSAAVIQTTAESNAAAVPDPEQENSVHLTLWRSHLRAPQDQDVNSSTPPEHIYHTVGGGRSDADVPSPPTNHEPGQEGGGGERSARPAETDFRDREGNSVYAQVSKKVRQATPPEVLQVMEEESSPPLPDRRTETEG